MIEAASFQETIFSASDAGSYTFSFDAKAPFEGGIAAPTTAYAYIRVLDPNNGFASSVDVRVDLSAVSNTEWARYTVEATLDESLDGQILQFGFSNSATGYNPSGVFYDNVNFSIVE